MILLGKKAPIGTGKTFPLSSKKLTPRLNACDNAAYISLDCIGKDGTFFSRPKFADCYLRWRLTGKQYKASRL
jgi:hypothetical protein